MMLDLSLIIVTYNSMRDIGACLQSISAGCAGLSYEVIIADNASTDGTPQFIREQHPTVQLIANDDNKGFAGGNNQGLARAQGRYLVLLNPDVVLHEASFAPLIAFMEAHPQVGISGPRMFNGAGEPTLTAYNPYSVGMILWQYIGLDRLFPHVYYGKYRRHCESGVQPIQVGWVNGACFIIRRAVYEQIGGLDEGLFLFAEEPDYCERALQKNWQTYYLPLSSITHHESTSVSRYPLRKIRNYHISPLHYFRKRGQHGAVLLLKLGFTLELGVKSVIYWLRRGSDGQARREIYQQVLREVWKY
jgi:GT2 family glycosyltransferase